MSDARDLRRGRADLVIERNLIRICICFPILILGLVIYNIYHLPPFFQLKRLYLPGLDKSLNSTTNSSITFDIHFENWALYSNAYFDPINVTFYDGPNLNHSISYFTIPDFILDYKGKVEYSGMVNATGLDLDDAKQEIENNGFKVFRVDLITSLRYDLYAFWKTGRHAYQKSVDVKIGHTGAAAKFGSTFVGMRVLAMLNLVVLLFLCSY